MILLLGTALTLALLPSNLPAAVVPLLQEEWSASSVVIGSVFGAYTLGYGLAVLVVLPLTDRFSTRAIVLSSAALTGLASIAFALVAADALSATLLRLVAGAGLAGVYMPGVRLVAAAAEPARRGFAVGAYVAGFYLAGSLSLLATGLLLAFVDWRGAALVLGVLALAALLPAAIGTRDAPAGLRGTARLDLGVLREPHLARVVAAYSAHAWELYVARGWLPAFLAAILASAGASAVAASSEASVWAAILLGLGTIGVFAGGAVSDRVGRSRTAVLAAASSGALSIVLGLLGGAPWIVVLAVGGVLGFLISADSAVYSTAVTELVPADRLGSAQALQASLGFIASAIGPVVAGAALDLELGWPGVFAVGGVASLVGAALLLPMVGRPRIAPRGLEASRH